jgi:hypothetical protein
MEVTNLYRKRLDKTNQLVNINKTTSNQSNNPYKSQKNNKQNNINNNNNSILIDKPQCFSLESNINLIKDPKNNNKKTTITEKDNSKKVKKLEISNPINLIYQRNSVRNHLGISSFNENNENYSNCGFTIDSKILNKKSSQNKKSEFYIVNEVNESYNTNNKNKDIIIEKNIEITNTNNIQYSPFIKKETDNHIDENNNYIYNNTNDNILVNKKEKISSDFTKNNIDIENDLIENFRKNLVNKRVNDSIKTFEILGIKNDDSDKFNIISDNNIKNIANNKNNSNNINSNNNNFNKEKNVEEKGDLNNLNNINELNKNKNENEIIVLPTNKNKNKNYNNDNNDINNKHMYSGNN